MIYVLTNIASPETLRGWAIPAATDIAFAVAVLAIIGSHLPSALRIFLPTQAVVDDLIAISFIAVFHTSDLQAAPLLFALVPLALNTFHAHKCRRFFGTKPAAAWLILLPLGIATWALVHASGIHATVAGVLLGFAIPVIRSKATGGPEAGPGLSEIFEHRFRPISAGVAVPVFAFFSAGVAVAGWEGLGSALTDPVALGIILALDVGETHRNPRDDLGSDESHHSVSGQVLSMDRCVRGFSAGRHRIRRHFAPRGAELWSGQRP